MKLAQSENTTASVTSQAETRIVVGYDGSTSGKLALDQCLHLCCPGPKITLVGVVESPMPPSVVPPVTYAPPLANWVWEREEATRQALSGAIEGMGAIGAEQRLAHGDAATQIMKIADEEAADLVVIGHNRRDRFDDLLLGSVARRLLHECPRHLMIARPKPEKATERVAVFASDDSPEATRCLEEFIRLAPHGLTHVYVLMVNQVDAGAAAMLVRGLSHLQHKAEGWIDEGLRHDASQHCATLQASGFDATPIVIEGEDIATAIGDACDTVGASLVVLASPPHGLWDRLLNGSVTEDLLAGDSRSLLVLRP